MAGAAYLHSVAGYICQSGVPVPGANVQCRFQGAGAQVWSDPIQADANGYFSFNLGSDDLLGNTGVVLSNDRVIVAAWLGNPSRTSDLIVNAAWASVVLTSDGAFDLSFNLPTDPDDAANVPDGILDLSPVNDARAETPLSADTLMYAHRVNSAPAYPGGADSYSQQWYPAGTVSSPKTVEIFHALRIASASFDWVYDTPPGDVETFLHGAEGDPPYAVQHSYPAADIGLTRTIRGTAVVRGDGQAAGLSAESYDVLVRARLPAPAFSWNAAVAGELTTFSPGIVDPDAAVTSVDYEVDGIPVIVGVQPDTSWAHVFMTEGTHTVRQIVHYDDGHDTGTVDLLENVEVASAPPVAAFLLMSTEYIAAQLWTWADASTDFDGAVVAWTWVLEIDNAGTWEEVARRQGAPSFSHAFTTEGDYRLTLTVTDNSGESASVQSAFTVTLGGGGAVQTGAVIAVPKITRMEQTTRVTRRIL